MPSTVWQLLQRAGLAYGGCVPWGTPLPVRRPGVYLVSLNADARSSRRTVARYPVSHQALEELLRSCPELRLDHRHPTTQDLSKRLAAFWLADEVVLYIGLAGTSLRSRVSAYYRTPLGAKRPHAGGWFLKTLSNLGDLHVHYAECEDVDASEKQLLAAFCESISAAARASLHDPERPMPFANLEWPRGIYKRHGITGARTRAERTPFRQGPAVVDEVRQRGASNRIDAEAINRYLQRELKQREEPEVAAVEAARWLDEAGLSSDIRI